MLEINLLENEKIIIISNEGILQINNKHEDVSIIITNQRFLIFKLPINTEYFRIGRIIDTFKSNNLELLFETSIENIDEIITNDKLKISCLIIFPSNTIKQRQSTHYLSFMLILFNAK